MQCDKVIDPQLVGDVLMSIDFFEKQLKQDDSTEANTAYLKAPLTMARENHSGIQEAAATYPSCSQYNDTSEEDKSKFREWAEECFPCDIDLDISDLDVGGDLFNLYNQQINTWAALYNDLLKLDDALSEITSDACRIMALRNFTCVPDIQKFVALMSYLMSKYKFELGKLNFSIKGLAISLVGKIVHIFVARLDQLIQTAISTVDCYLSSIDRIGDKLQVDLASAKEYNEAIEDGVENAQKWTGLNKIFETFAEARQKLVTDYETFKEEIERFGNQASSVTRSIQKVSQMSSFIFSAISFLTKLSSVAMDSDMDIDDLCNENPELKGLDGLQDQISEELQIDFEAAKLPDYKEWKV